MDKADLPVFKMKCPACKGKVGIRIPIMGGTTECFELGVKDSIRITTKAPFTVNGEVELPKVFNDNTGEEE
jgi:hypothetical protein